MNIYILLAHPESDSFNGQIAETYYRAALAKGHNVRIQKLGEMHFDPILRKGMDEQDMEPDLLVARENILWCNRWVVVFPMWWGSVPALFKGFIDRAMTSGFAFRYRENSAMWDKLLKGRSGEIIATCDAPAFWVRAVYFNSDIHTVKQATMNYCGISPVKVTRIPMVRSASPEKRLKILRKIAGKVR